MKRRDSQDERVVAQRRKIQKQLDDSEPDE
jgi:hypothetical protein